MIPTLFSLLLMFHKINCKFLLNSDSSSIIVVRHIRLSMDSEHYRIRCPYNLNQLTLTLLNYSNDNCFDLYTRPIYDACTNHRSPCTFHAKPVQLKCNDHSYANHVDITYHCSLSFVTSSTTKSPNKEKTSTLVSIEGDPSVYSSLNQSGRITLHTLSFPSTSFKTEESVGIFLIGLVTVFILWLTVCCMWFMRCGRNSKEDDGKCELLSVRPYSDDNPIDLSNLTETKPTIVGNLSRHTSTGGLENICVYVNPIENKRISSVKITQID